MKIDAHAHVDRYGSTLDAALDQISRLQILTLGVSMDPASYARTKEIAARCEWVVPSFGIHPWEAPEALARLEEVNTLIDESPILGEIGLDFRFVKDSRSHESQRTVFSHFAGAASRQDKIVNLHTAGAERDVLEVLDRHAVRRVIVHWYSGPIEILGELLKFGALFTVGVEVIRSEGARKIAAAIPPDRLLTETDGPGAGEWLTGRPGEPRDLLEVLTTLAEIHGTEEATIEQMVTQNLRRLIGEDRRLSGIKSRLDSESTLEGAVAIPVDGTLDLHTFQPRDVKELVPEYLRLCRERGILQVRIIHGKGTGTLQQTVTALIGRMPEVIRASPGGDEGGGWGATIVWLRPKS